MNLQMCSINESMSGKINLPKSMIAVLQGSRSVELDGSKYSIKLISRITAPRISPSTNITIIHIIGQIIIIRNAAQRASTHMYKQA